MGSILLYFSLALALILIILLFFSRQIKIWLISFRHGKYSYRYIQHFKKYANKSPYPYCFKDEILPYLQLSNFKKGNMDVYQSEKPLLFENIPYHLSVGEIKNQYGRPDCFNAFIIKNKELRAYGYKKIFFGIEVKAVFFFTGDSFLMGEYIIEDLSVVDIVSFSRSIKIHYGVDADGETLLFKIVGKDDSSLFFYDNGFSVIVRYTYKSNVQFRELIK
jgi:hypothetical protein